MGWTFVRQTRDQLIRELVAPQASERACCEVIDHTLDGDVLWTVVRVTARQAGVMGLAAGESVCYIGRSEEHTSELQSLMRISYAVFCLKKKKNKPTSLQQTHRRNIRATRTHTRSQKTQIYTH